MAHRVFAPLSGLCPGESLVGWSLGPSTACVAGSCPPGQLDDLRAATGEWELEVLGRCLRRTDGQGESSRPAGGSTELDLYVTGKKHLEPGSGCITYHPPQTTRLRYLSLEPIDLGSPRASAQERALSRKLDALDEAWAAGGRERPSRTAGTTSGAGEAKGEKGKRPVGRDDEAPEHQTTLQDVLSRINTAARVQSAAARLRVPGRGRTRSASAAPPSDLRTRWSFRAWTGVAALARGLDAGLQAGPLERLGRASLTVTQLRTRLRQVAEMPEAFLCTRAGEGDLHARNQAYISFYNMVWLIANDVIVGMTIAAFLRDFSVPLAARIDHFLQAYAVDAVRHGLLWLDDWPVGLKLNTPLSRVYCDVLGGLTASAGACMTRASPALPALLRGAALVSRFGGAFAICLALDGLHAAGAHLALAHRGVAQVYRWEMASLYSLWNLFRGKRWNTLRGRVDSYDYELDQLFLGTLLFTVSLFLLPTVLTYYLYFVVIRCAMLALQASCEVALALLNTFPLFAVMLRLKEPSRIPGGVRFDISFDSAVPGRPGLHIKNQPISFAQIFARFGESWTSLGAAYGPSRVLTGIAQGSL